MGKSKVRPMAKKRTITKKGRSGTTRPPYTLFVSSNANAYEDCRFGVRKFEAYRPTEVERTDAVKRFFRRAAHNLGKKNGVEIKVVFSPHANTMVAPSCAENRTRARRFAHALRNRFRRAKSAQIFR